MHNIMKSVDLIGGIFDVGGDEVTTSNRALSLELFSTLFGFIEDKEISSILLHKVLIAILVPMAHQTVLQGGNSVGYLSASSVFLQIFTQLQMGIL